MENEYNNNPRDELEERFSNLKERVANSLIT
jgi:hypothetical protein